MSNSAEVAQLRKKVWSYYRAFGRHDLPWRRTRDPYRILVSEVMLQQTQVVRVVPKYREFLRAFPTVRSLARAELRDVLGHWQGLGYNRRGKALHDAARVIVRDYKGKVPSAYADLVRLPGIGPYTAAAVRTFAFGEATPMVETNIRTVLFQHFFQNRTAIPDSEVLQLTKVLSDTARPREWHWALMDYGAYLKVQGIRVNTQSKHYNKQTRFRGSDREIRGKIVRMLTRGSGMSEREVARNTKADPVRVRMQLKRLANEGMAVRRKGKWYVA